MCTRAFCFSVGVPIRDSNKAVTCTWILDTDGWSCRVPTRAIARQHLSLKVGLRPIVLKKDSVRGCGVILGPATV